VVVRDADEFVKEIAVRDDAVRAERAFKCEPELIKCHVLAAGFDPAASRCYAR
jgi:hypothetical protein